MVKRMNKTGEGVKISVPYSVVKMNLPKRIRLSKVKRNTQRVYDVGTGIAIMKRCGKCGVLTLYKDMVKKRKNNDGMNSECLNCRKAYNAIPENKKRQAEYNAEYYAVPENKKRKAEYDAEYYANPENKKRRAEYGAEYYAIPENKKRKAELDAEYYAIPENKKRKAESKAEWQRNNPEKVAKNQAKRNARKRNLPTEDISFLSFDTCVLTGATDNVHIEHLVPLAIGHGGTYFANCYAMEGSANKSKGNRNPFEWYERFGERFGITNEAWSDLIEDMANRNRMDTSEYVRFVNWCFDNPRTLEQIKADNKRYGYVVDSLTLYREAMANMATIEIA